MARSGIALHYLKSYREECGLTQRELAEQTLHMSKGKLVPLDRVQLANYEGLKGESKGAPDDPETGKRRVLTSPGIAAALAKTLEKHLRKRLRDPDFLLTVHDLANVPAAEKLREWQEQRARRA